MTGGHVGLSTRRRKEVLGVAVVVRCPLVALPLVGWLVGWLVSRCFEPSQPHRLGPYQN